MYQWSLLTSMDVELTTVKCTVGASGTLTGPSGISNTFHSNSSAWIGQPLLVAARTRTWYLLPGCKPVTNRKSEYHLTHTQEYCLYFWRDNLRILQNKILESYDDSPYPQTAHNSCKQRTLNASQGKEKKVTSNLHTAACGYITVTFLNWWLSFGYLHHAVCFVYFDM